MAEISTQSSQKSLIPLHSGNLLLMIVANHGQANPLVTGIQSLGVKHFTSFFGKGTVNIAFLNRLGLLKEKKDVILTSIQRDQEEAVLTMLVKKFQMHLPNKGIAITVPLIDPGAFPLPDKKDRFYEMPAENSKKSYKAVFTIVDRERTADVIAIGKKEGCPRGTIIEARGSTEHSIKLFDIPIQAEKDIILQLVQAADAHRFADALTRELDFHSANQGILLMLNVRRAIGLSSV